RPERLCMGHPRVGDRSGRWAGRLLVYCAEFTAPDEEWEHGRTPQRAGPPLQAQGEDAQAQVEAGEGEGQPREGEHRQEDCEGESGVERAAAGGEVTPAACGLERSEEMKNVACFQAFSSFLPNALSAGER